MHRQRGLAFHRVKGRNRSDKLAPNGRCERDRAVPLVCQFSSRFGGIVLQNSATFYNWAGF